MTTNPAPSMGTEILANIEGFLKKFRVTKENDKDREILTLANLDSGYIRKFIVKKVDERSLFRRRSSTKSQKDVNENKSRRNSKNLKNGDLKRLKKQKDARRLSTTSLDSNTSQKSTFSLRSLRFGGAKSKEGLKPDRKCKSIENLDSIKKKKNKKKRHSEFALGLFNIGFGSSSESDEEQDTQSMTIEDLDEKGDPGVVNPAFMDLEDEGVDLEKDKEVLETGRLDGDGMSDTDSLSSRESTSSDAEPKFNLKMSPRPLRRSHRNRSPQQSPDSYRSSYQSNRSSVCSTRKGILKKAASSTTINMEMNNMSQPQTPTENGHTSKFADPFEECKNGDAPKFVRSTGETGLQHQRSFNRVKFILDSGRPDNVTGDYDDIKIEQKNERDRSKSIPDKEDTNGLSRSGRKCLIFSAGLLILTLAVILGSLFGSHKFDNYTLKGTSFPLDDKYIRNAIEGRFKITNKEFSEALHNYESDEFKKMSKDLEALIAKVIHHEATPNQANSTVTLRIIKILKGSIEPIFRIKWSNKDLLDDSEIRKRILRHLDKFGSIGEYKVDKTSVTVAQLQNHCHKSLSDCSHTCIFSPETLKFLCRCPDTLVLSNNTLCISPQQTTRKMPFIVPPVVNNIIKDSGAQFHSVNPETVDKKNQEEEAETPDDDAVAAGAATGNGTSISNGTTTAKPDQVIPSIDATNGTTVSALPTSADSSTEAPTKTTVASKQSDSVEDIVVTQPMNVSKEPETTPAPQVEQQNSTQATVSVSENEITTPFNNTSVSSQQETTITDSSQPNATATTISSSTNTPSTTSDTETSTASSALSSSNATSSGISSSTTSMVDIAPSGSTEKPKNVTYDVTTELISSSSDYDGMFVSSVMNVSLESTTSTPSSNSSLNQTVSEPKINIPLNETINTQTSNNNTVFPETNGTFLDGNNNITVEVVTVQAIPITKLSSTTSSVIPSESSSLAPNISINSNVSTEYQIPIGVIADVSNTLSGAVQPTVETEETQRNNVTVIEDVEEEKSEQLEETCSAEQFQCVSGTSRFGQCIPVYAHCDSVYDCHDHSDEESCIENKCLNNYQCWSGDCIQRKYVCDGIRHCPDGGDEEGCETWTCSADEFECLDSNGKSICIQQSQKCDGQPDCANHTDEKGCFTECSNDQFMCPEGYCIPDLWKCDGTQDCSGGEDELECDCDGLDQSPCSFGGCVPTFKLCDGLRQCPDGSDEYGCLRIDDITKQLEVRSEEKRWSAVCGDKWTAGWTELVCEQLGFGEAVSTEVRKVNESVPKPRVKLSPDAPKAAQRGRAPLQYFLTPGECATNPLVHISCKQPTCGKWPKSNTDAVGHDANDPAWPSLGLLIQPGSYDDINLAFGHSCAATLITPAWVIASYSCLVGKPNGLDPDKWAFLIGESAPRVGQRKTQLRHAKQVVVYPGAKRKDGIWLGDAVLLRLQSSIKLDEATQLACLSDTPARTHSHCKIISWVENEKEEGGLIQNVQKLPVPNLTLNTCNTSYYNGKLEQEHSCASFLQPSHSPCDGKEGSPLMCKSDGDAWELHGLLSLTSTCARFDLPSVFTDVTSIHGWVMNTVEWSPHPAQEVKTTTVAPSSESPPVARSSAHREANQQPTLTSSSDGAES